MTVLYRFKKFPCRGERDMSRRLRELDRLAVDESVSPEERYEAAAGAHLLRRMANVKISDMLHDLPEVWAQYKRMRHGAA